jgi:hypothetical protein
MIDVEARINAEGQAAKAPGNEKEEAKHKAHAHNLIEEE